MGKAWYTSKTLWVSFIVFIAAVINLFGFITIPVDPEASWVAMALSVIQVLLRLITKEPVTIEKQ